MNRYVLSFPRSGVTWMRYCVEFLSQMPTEGQAQNDNAIEAVESVDPDADPVVEKAHRWRYVEEPSKTALLIRDHMEVLSRGHVVAGNSFEHVIKKGVPWYTDLIKKHRKQCSGPLLRYENTITDDGLEAELWKLCEFFGPLDGERVPLFMEDVDHYRKDSLDRYGGNKKTDGEKKRFYRDQISEEQVQKLDEAVRSRLSDEEQEKYLLSDDERE